MFVGRIEEAMHGTWRKFGEENEGTRGNGEEIGKLKCFTHNRLT